MEDLIIIPVGLPPRTAALRAPAGLALELDGP